MKHILAKIVDVKPDEIRALWLGFAFFFVVLAGYYVIRPVRDNIGATQFENLWWMFTVVLVAMIFANALFSAIVSRMSRRRFIPIAYRFFILNLVIFFVLMRYIPPGKQPWVDGCFFVWVSVFNLFATAVFCRQCSGTMDCPNCSVALTFHRHLSCRQIERWRVAPRRRPSRARLALRVR